MERESSPDGGAYDVRPMRAGDIAAVMEVERRSFPAPWSPQVFLDELGRSHAHVDVLVTGEDWPVGFVNYWLVADEVHLLNLALGPEHRGRGLGTRLLAHVVAFARGHACRVVTLEVRRSNLTAQHLYRKAGFRAVSVRPAYYTDNHEDAIVMILDL